MLGMGRRLWLGSCGLRLGSESCGLVRVIGLLGLYGLLEAFMFLARRCLDHVFL